jgi:serine/threonine protein kinase, bacterial
MIGKVLDYRYRIIRVLATGGFGQTYIAEDTRRPGNPICVVKHLKPSSFEPKMFETAKRLFQTEAESLEKLGSHSQIPRLLAYFDENQEFYLVQEFIEGCTLDDELVSGHRWTEAKVIQMLHELLSLLEFVHAQGVIHRDIKPDNIIRRASDNKLVLVDFGAVKQLGSNLTTLKQSTATVAIGTPGYMATEQAQGKPRPNSDIYSIGIIAIHALTGIAATDLREDPNTGEFVWQHLASVSPRLVTVLNKMVRYHFKDRYQTASEALQALNSVSGVVMANAGVKEYATPSAPVTSPVAARRPSTPSAVQTIAFAPKNPVAAKPVRKDSYRPDPLPLLIGVALAAGAAAFATNIVTGIKNSNFNIFNFANTNAEQRFCMAMVEGNSNLRSEPTARFSDTIVQRINKNTAFEVTGKRTKRGWVEVRIDSQKTAWVDSQVIANSEEWKSCLRDRGVAIKTVDDKGLIASRPTPKPQPRANPSLEKNQDKNQSPFSIFNIFNSSANSSAKPKPKLLPKPEVKPEIKEESAKPSDDSAQVVQEAQKKYESGDLQGAIELLKSVGENASTGIQQTTEMASQWQKDWVKAEGFFNEVNKAVENGQWNKVMDYKNHPEKMPNIQYWRDKVDPLFQEAAKNLEKQIIPESPTEKKNNPKPQTPKN